MLSLALLLALFALPSELDTCATSIGADRPHGFTDPQFLAGVTWEADAVVYARVIEIEHDVLGPYPTLVNLLVTSVQKGKVPRRIQIVLETGPTYAPVYGTLGTVWSSHSPSFDVGEQVILFLRHREDEAGYHPMLDIRIEGTTGRTELKSWWLREIEREVRRAAVAQETACQQVSSWDPAFLGPRELQGKGLDAALLEQLRLELLMSDRARPFVLGLEAHLAEIQSIFASDPALTSRLNPVLSDVRPTLLHLFYRDVRGRDVVLDAERAAALHEVGRKMQEKSSPELVKLIEDLLAEIRKLEGLPASEAYLTFLALP